MAKLLVSSMLLEDLLFHGRRAVITNATFDNDKIILEIEGPDVPNAELVRCITTKTIDTKFESCDG